MGAGRGKGGANQTGAIAAGCGAIYCMVCFFLFGLPMLIGGIVLVRLAAGDYDESVRTSIEDCLAIDNDDDWYSGSSWWRSSTTSTTTHEWTWSNHDDDDCLQWEDWEDVKKVLGKIGVALIVLSLVSLVSGLVLLLLMFTSLCKKSGGTVHQPAAAGTQPLVLSQQATYPVQVGQQSAYPTQVQSYPIQTQGYPTQPQVYPMQPPAYPAQGGFTNQTQIYGNQAQTTSPPPTYDYALGEKNNPAFAS